MVNADVFALATLFTFQKNINNCSSFEIALWVKGYKVIKRRLDSIVSHASSNSSMCIMKEKGTN